MTFRTFGATGIRVVALLVTLLMPRILTAFPIVINSTDLTISGDGDDNDQQFKGVPFLATVQDGIARFHLQGDMIVEPLDTVTLTGDRPVMLIIGGNAVLANGAVVDCSGRGCTPGPGGGAGGLGGSGGAATPRTGYSDNRYGAAGQWGAGGNVANGQPGGDGTTFAGQNGARGGDGGGGGVWSEWLQFSQ